MMMAVHEMLHTDLIWQIGNRMKKEEEQSSRGRPGHLGE